MRVLKTALILAAILLGGVAAQAQQKGNAGDKGLGIILGEPTGISFKTYLSSKHAFDLGLAWSLDGEKSLYIHGDYLYHNHSFFNPNRGRMPLYYGIGGRIILGEHRNFAGVRVPFGVEYIFQGMPIGLFLEIAPVMDLTPKTRFDINGGLGARYYF